MKYFFLFIFSLCNYCYAQTKTDLIKIVADDRADRDCFGWSTSIYGNYCIVGAVRRKAKKLTGHRLLPEGGGAYIFAKQPKGNWLQTQLLLPDQPKENDFYGGCVSMYDGFIAVGCNGDDDVEKDSDSFNRKGAVYIYKLNKQGVWSKTQKIILEDRTSRDDFGEQVFLYKKTLAVSARYKPFKDPKIKGAVYIYEQSPAGSWIQKHSIICPEKDVVQFGHSISLSDSLLVIGSLMPENTYVYKLTINNTWALIKKLSATNTSDAGFGRSVCIKNNIVCVGAYGIFDPNDSTDNSDTLAYRKKHLLGSGAVYIYEMDIKNNLNFKQRIVAKDIKADMHFGMCMSISDSLLVIGAFGDALDVDNLPGNRYAGAAYIFKQNTLGEWIETKKITSPQRSVWDKFAFSVSAYKKTVIIGSRFEKENAQEKQPIFEAGAAYIYEDK